MLVNRFKQFCMAVAGSLLLTTAAAADTPDHKHSVAVVIGNKAYKEPTPAVAYAHRDAAAMKRYLVEVLGYDEDNIIDLRDATQSQIEAALGNARSHEGLMWRLIRPNRSHVTVYYSGHGVPGLNDKRGYLLPVDVEPDSAEIGGYPIDVLYENLGKLEARSATVYLDACFSGNSSEGMLVRSASPVYVKTEMPKSKSALNVLTAATAEQVASWDNDNQHGLFTYHLLRGLRGEADKPPFGDGDGTVRVREVRAYLDEEMTYAARRAFGRRQHASIQASDDVVLGHVPTEQTPAPVQAPAEETAESDAAEEPAAPAQQARAPGIEVYEFSFKSKRAGAYMCEERSGTFEVEVADGKIVSSTLEHAPVRGTIGEWTARGNFGVHLPFEARRDGDVYKGEWTDRSNIHGSSINGCAGSFEITRKPAS